jgi:alanyl-tRNA synthetase
MQDVSGNNIRTTFLRFFEEKGHRPVASSSLVPANDPTLLFTNAGMNQFKDVFTGAERRAYSRAASSQKCVRAGGKHNDLENVGFTRRHHTFFEMLGNFSFGDYFKREAIAYAWELITSPEWFAIPKDKLYVTVFEGDDNVTRDDEAEDFWVEVGVPKERILAFGAKDNFWQMGETGPCGPCSEIFYDMGIEASESVGPDGAKLDLPFGKDEARYVEIWNLVFMQFERSVVADAAGKTTGYSLAPLPKPSIDTGMGLERVAAVLQGKLSNFETDLFEPLTSAALTLVRFASGKQQMVEVADAKSAASFRVIADHARAAVFLINDGVSPSNEGRGYVLRKIIRRAIWHTYINGAKSPIFHYMTKPVVDLMGVAYPELVEAKTHIEEAIKREEQKFFSILEVGSKQFTDALDASLDLELLALGGKYSTDEIGFEDSPDTRASIERSFKISLLRKFNLPAIFPGAIGFRLYETFGLPLDFMMDAARDAGVDFDLSGFEIAKSEEQARARASWKGGSAKSASPAFRDLPKTDFLGYAQLVASNAEVLAIVKDGVGVPAAKAGDEVQVVLDRTSFYGDSGGQVGDTGRFTSPDGNLTAAEITGCVLPVQGVRAHKAVLKQDLAIGDHVNTVVDGVRRDAIKRNHTGTHLLHAALRQVLGTHVKQAGSLVDPGRLRFDFSHFAQVAPEELEEIESIVNHEVLTNAHVQTMVDVPIDVAVNEYHAMALFGEKYGDKVRVVKIGDFSTELCGGTHTLATGEIGLIKIVGEGSVSSGVRRLEAISGTGALEEFRSDFAVAQIASQLAPTAETSPADALRLKLAANEDELKKLRRELEEMRMKSASGTLDAALAGAVEVSGVKVATLRADSLDRGQLRTLVDNLKQRLGEGVVVLGSAQPEGKVAIIAGVSDGLVKRIQAGKLVGAVAQLVGGSGGGKPNIAEAGGKDQAQLPAALAAVPGIVAGLLG